MYKIGEIVEVNRRVDPNSVDPNAAREWVKAEVRSIWGAITVAFFDNYRISTTNSNGETAYNPVYIRACKQEPTFRNIVLGHKKRLHDNCPRCGHPGQFIRMALVCPIHGVWAGC